MPPLSISRTALCKLLCLTLPFVACERPTPDPPIDSLPVAIRAADPDAVRSLLEADPAQASQPTPDGRYPLHLTDDPTIIRLLIDSGADPVAEDRRGRSPVRALLDRAVLFHGLRERAQMAVDVYLDSGVSLSDGDEGVRLLHPAARVGQARLVRHLLDGGVDPSSLNASGGTLLHSSAAGGLGELVSELIGRGFDVDARNRYGLTPLIMASMEGHPEIVRELLGAGAVAGVMSPAGWNAADYAAGFGHADIVLILGDRGVKAEPGRPTRLAGPYLGMSVPGLEPELFAPGVVSSIHYDHSAPVFSPDGREVFWSAVYTSRGDYVLSMKVQGGTWSAPRIEPFCRFGETCMYPTLSADGTKLFFTSDRAAPGGEPGSGMDIWVADREGESWSEPTWIGFDGGDEYGLSISAAGTLYFMADYPGGEGSTDLYRSRLVNGSYEDPVNLGNAINSPFYEDEPFIAGDESFLLFASLRPDESGEGRLYLSERGDDGSWSAPVNISSRFGLTGDLRFPAVSRDGRYVFVGSNRNGNWDLYWMDAAVLGVR